MFLLAGCSTTTLKDFFSEGDSTEKRNEKLMTEDFKEEKDVFEKFKESKVAVKEKEVKKETLGKKTLKPKKLTHPKKRTDIRPPKMNRVLKPRKDSKKPKNEKVEKKKDTVKSKVVNKEEYELPYPADYPKDLKELDKKTQEFWYNFTPYVFPGEQTVLNITYLGVNTGKVTISSKNHTRLGDHDAYHVNARVKTADFYSYLYEVDDYCDSYIKKENFGPLKFSLIQRQSSQDIDDLQLFDQDELRVFSFYKRVTKEKQKKEKKKEWIPHYFQDPLSILYFIRGLPMDPKVKYAVPIINSGKVELLYAQYEKTETIKTKIGNKKAYRLNIYTKAKGKTLKGGGMTFWYSADERRVFLKFQAKIKIGSISGEIESYKK